jgi:hypothetical protein
MSTTTCPPIPDYQTLRKENLIKIQKYYDELLKDYSGLGGNDMNSAQNLISSYNIQLNSAAQELVNNLNKTIDLVSEQHSNLQDNNNLVVSNRHRLTQLKKDIKSLKIENEARQSNLQKIHKTTNTIGWWHIAYLIFNVLLLCIAIALVISLFMK